MRNDINSVYLNLYNSKSKNSNLILINMRTAPLIDRKRPDTELL